MAEGNANVESLSYKVISSGSIFDIKKPGIYYLTASVTDKPIAGGGTLILGAYDNITLSGIYVSQYTKECFCLDIASNTISNIYKVPTFKTEDFTGTTSTTGAWGIPVSVADKTIVSFYPTNMVACVFRRDANYLGVKDYSNFSPVAEQSVTIRITYIE